MTQPMPLDRRGQFEALVLEFARADARVNAAIGARHAAMHACNDWVQAYAEELSTSDKPQLSPLALRDEELPHPGGVLDVGSPGADTFTRQKFEKIHTSWCVGARDHDGLCIKMPS